MQSVSKSAPLDQTASAVLRDANGHIVPLESGDRLTQRDFHRRYLAHPKIKKAELVEGVVYVASPVRALHSGPHGLLIAWLNNYCADTPGTEMYPEATLIVDAANEVQPDGCLFRDRAHGGRLYVTPSGYLAGVPDLIVEVAASSAAYDLGAKRDLYFRLGVSEYVVALTLERTMRWHRWEAEAYTLIESDASGIWRSFLFPGLWLDGPKLWQGDRRGVQATLETGLHSPEHAAFLAQLAGYRQD